ncbi:LysR family transcriptional regulator [Cellulophaga omnivescoria]|uniref:LysR family transcriptional regulator n=1 Tax=Cellulophaga omnivescoria TaxID=1888890 RepID=UPI000985A6DD|nr:LysR family transcriptional regulator [Cellulophaga omnivescoria]
MISKSNQLELRQVQYFIMLSTTLHYRKAAEKLHISQSALSQQIKILETTLGAKLFERTNRKVTLSYEGSVFLQEANLIVEQVDRSLENWQMKKEGKKGQLKIGFVGSAMQKYLPKVLKKFSSDQPLIMLNLQEKTNKEQLESLLSNKIDIGFIRSNSIPSIMGIKLVYEENFSLVLPQNHPLNEVSFTSIKQLSKESFILFPNDFSPMFFQQILNLCLEAGFSPNIQHQSIHAPTIFKLVENEMGISIIPNSLRDDKNYNVKYIELVKTPQKTRLYAVWLAHNKSKVLHYFLNHI